jgi:pyruvate dehydrogenase E2 component (dihydrolipoamide acetyltransferase)
MASSPLAKAFARRHNVDLAAIRGSGPAGRIIKQDIDNFLASKSATTV